MMKPHRAFKTRIDTTFLPRTCTLMDGLSKAPRRPDALRRPVTPHTVLQSHPNPNLHLSPPSKACPRCPPGFLFWMRINAPMKPITLPLHSPPRLTPTIPLPLKRAPQDGGLTPLPKYVFENPREDRARPVRNSRDGSEILVRREHFLSLQRIDEADHVPFCSHDSIVEAGNLANAARVEVDMTVARFLLPRRHTRYM